MRKYGKVKENFQSIKGRYVIFYLKSGKPVRVGDILQSKVSGSFVEVVGFGRSDNVFCGRICIVKDGVLMPPPSTGLLGLFWSLYRYVERDQDGWVHANVVQK